MCHFSHGFLSVHLIYTSSSSYFPRNKSSSSSILKSESQIFQLSSRSRQLKDNMCSTSKAWAVAASMSTVEVLKDQGFSRWNSSFRHLQQHAKNNLGSLSQPKRMVSSPIDGTLRESGSGNKAEKSEESFRKIMYLSCWGSN